jgi:cytochrome bd ubiquinol oxidase subunit II
MHALTTFNDWLPVIFMAVMGLAMLAYVVLDGYDLGVGILLRRASSADKDVMISSIGPFWEPGWCWAWASCSPAFRQRTALFWALCICRWR